MEQDLQNTIALLANFPATLQALLHNLPESWTTPNEGPDTWSVQDVVGHLADLEANNWLPRLQFILEHGLTQPLPAVNREAFRTTTATLDDFARYRAHNLKQLAALNLQPADLARLGVHPALGPVTVSQLLATWAIHDMTHLHQISRVLAHQYRDAIGPWKAYLSVVK